MRISAAIMALLATGVVALPVHPAADIDSNTDGLPNLKDTAILPETKAGADVPLQHNKHIKRILQFFPLAIPPLIAIIDKLKENSDPSYWENK
jgi:hypothetical protein